MTGIRRTTLFESDLLRIRHVAANGSTEPGELQRQESDIVVLPLRGICTKHDAPRRQATATPSHAMFIAAERPYRLSFPGRIGDECLTFTQPRGFFDDGLASHALLPAAAILARGLLARRLAGPVEDRLEIEEIGLALQQTALSTAAASRRQNRRPGTARRRSMQVERVKQAIGVEPERRWTLSALAGLADASAWHLARIFRDETGATLHDYVTRARLASALDRVLDADADLSAIALDSGFASHSHFSARFRALFGLAPSELRRAPGATIAKLRKILTAPLPGSA
jgi:AraC family transcriptional regulator